MLDIVKTILEVARGLFGFRADIAKANRERRDRVADYFSEVADLLDSTSASLKQRTYPSGSCSQLGHLADQMDQSLAGLVPEPDLLRFQSELRRVHEIEQLFSELSSLSDQAAAIRLKDLDEASGMFRATSMHLRVSDG